MRMLSRKKDENSKGPDSKIDVVLRKLQRTIEHETQVLYPEKKETGDVKTKFEVMLDFM